MTSLSEEITGEISWKSAFNAAPKFLRHGSRWTRWGGAPAHCILDTMREMAGSATFSTNFHLGFATNRSAVFKHPVSLAHDAAPLSVSGFAAPATLQVNCSWMRGAKARCQLQREGADIAATSCKVYSRRSFAMMRPSRSLAAALNPHQTP